VTFSVHYAESVFKTQVEPLSPPERVEVDAHIKSLTTQPLPEQGSNRVIRLRDASAPVQPFFAGRTRRFMIFHTVEGDRVVILGVFPARLRP